MFLIIKVSLELFSSLLLPNSKSFAYMDTCFIHFVSCKKIKNSFVGKIKDNLIVHYSKTVFF